MGNATYTGVGEEFGQDARSAKPACDMPRDRARWHRAANMQLRANTTTFFVTCGNSVAETACS